MSFGSPENEVNLLEGMWETQKKFDKIKQPHVTWTNRVTTNERGRSHEKGAMAQLTGELMKGDLK
jgi:hypothetical protein